MNQPGLSADARRAMEEARRILAPHFPGEEVRLYIARVMEPERVERNVRIAQALAEGRRAGDVARAEGVDPSTVRRVRRRVRGQFTP